MAVKGSAQLNNPCWSYVGSFLPSDLHALSAVSKQWRDHTARGAYITLFRIYQRNLSLEPYVDEVGRAAKLSVQERVRHIWRRVQQDAKKMGENFCCFIQDDRVDPLQFLRLAKEIAFYQAGSFCVLYECGFGNGPWTEIDSRQGSAVDGLIREGRKCKARMQDACASLSKVQVLKRKEKWRLVIIPEEISRFSGLLEFDFSGSHISVLPPELGACTQLRTLALARNNLKRIPVQLGNLQLLETLNLFGNAIDCLPEGLFCHLNHLRVLDLGHNRLKRLPPDIDGCSQLNQLNLRRNLLRALPKQICGLTQLRQLDLSHNFLSALPKKLHKLALLNDLNMSNNQITVLPSRKLEQLRHLQQLKLDRFLYDKPAPAQREEGKRGDWFFNLFKKS